MTKDKALTLALEALENLKEVVAAAQALGIKAGATGKDMRLGESFLHDDAITAINKALAQPEQKQTGIREIRVTETVKQEQESVGEVNRHGRDSHGRQWHSIHWYDANVDVPHGTKFYTAPPKSEQEPVLQDIEQYRLQMAGISTAAIGYWKESDGILPDYDTVALRDVAKLYSKYDALYKARWSAQPEQEPIVCCGDYATCMKSCTPRGRWLAEQEPVADRLVRQYINSLVANKPDEAANATKAMVDYVYTSLPKRSWVDLTEQEALDCFSPNPVTHRKNIAVKIKEKNT